ncbi:DUF6266 family protein [Pedobacter frigoris]|uniref:Uncharacterized protein n=1 Tax=Pedobacter frigoris TaxID=2571272 RepID=A0A4U1CSU5_9SPHI|nr:DUF6266 family protein [Pedobacter frigoris]TKC08818.1 hypothetical protein FA047_01595 [Pedobacter frigoris]
MGIIEGGNIRGRRKPATQMMLMAYCPGEENEDLAYYKTAGAKRSTGHDELELPGNMSGKSMELYISVISEDRKEVADSKYLGLYQFPLSLPLNLISPFCD